MRSRSDFLEKITEAAREAAIRLYQPPNPVSATDSNAMDEDTLTLRVAEMGYHQELARVADELINDIVNAARAGIEHVIEDHRQALQTFAQLETELREDALKYGLETGESPPHSALTFRVIEKIEYDDEEMIQWLKANNKLEFVRVKESIDKRSLNKALDSGELDTDIAEPVKQGSISLKKALVQEYLEWLYQHKDELEELDEPDIDEDPEAESEDDPFAAIDF